MRAETMNTTATPVKLDGKEYVIVPRHDFERLSRLAKVAEMPALPKPDKDGNYPAVEYARASLARKIIRDRVRLDLTQRELADMAGIRIETLCRIETGKHSPSMSTMTRIDRALKRAERQREGR
jgi:DNA-binding XRE family transcriptional regulator